MTEWEACDKILQYLVDYPKRVCSPEYLKTTLFPEVEQDTVDNLIQYIRSMSENMRHPLVTVHQYNDGGIKATSATKMFLDEGGFTKHQKDIDDHKEFLLF